MARTDKSGSQADEGTAAQEAQETKGTSDTPLEEQTLLEQMGGLTGLVSATLPVLVLVPVNQVWGMGPALAAALGVAVLITIWRIARKESLQPAISGLLGVALCAAIAYFTGSAKGYFLYGIWASLVLFIAAAASIVCRWPAVGVVWKGINGEPMVWRQVPKALHAYDIATAGWALIFIARFLVQNGIYNSGDTTTSLGVVRILMGWPLTGIVTLLTIWMVRRANEAVEEAIAAGLVELPAAADDSASSADPNPEHGPEASHDES